MPGSVVFLPIFPTGWTTNKQKPRTFTSHRVWPKHGSVSGLAPVRSAAAAGAPCQALATCPGALGSKGETAAGTRSTGSSHGDGAYSLPTFTSLPGALPFPSWRLKPVLRLQTFPFLPLWSAMGTLPYTVTSLS